MSIPDGRSRLHSQPGDGPNALPSAAVSDAIHVSVSGKRTQITVRDWPSKEADWRVSTGTVDGRKLQVFGWSDWKDDQLVGSLTLHIDKAIMITGRWLSDTLLRTEQPHALATMVACAEQITVRLYQQRVGNGCLEWELEHQDVDYVQRLFSDYHPRKRRLRRGKRYLRKRLIGA
jgi:hypothetical protein